MCPICRRQFGSDEAAAFPRNSDLIQTIGNLKRSQEAGLGTDISPVDLELTDEIIGRGADGTVRVGTLQTRGARLQVSCSVSDGERLTIKRCGRCCCQNILTAYTAA